MADIESLQIEIQAALCTLSEERLKDVCSGLEITLPPESKGSLVFIRACLSIAFRLACKMRILGSK